MKSHGPEDPAPKRRRRPTARQITILAHEVAAEAVVAMIVRRPLLAISIMPDEDGHIPRCVYRSWSGAAAWPTHRRHAALTACALAPLIAHHAFTGRWPNGWLNSPRLRAVARIARSRTADEVEHFIVGRLRITEFMLRGYKGAVEKVAYQLLVHGTVAPTFVRSAIEDVLTGTSWGE